MTCDNVVTGIVTGIIASVIIIIVQSIHDYLKRKKYEQYHLYEFESFDVDDCAPPEYARESGNTGSTKVKMELPFDVRSLQVSIKDKLIYAEKNIPANSPIYICCYCDLFDDDLEVAYTVKCVTNQHEEREYEYRRIYTMNERPIGYALKLKKQKCKLKLN